MEIRVLGPVEVERDGDLLSVGGPQQRRLLAFLVVHRGHAISTDRIVDALWPDGEPPDGAARSMRTYMSRLRTVLPDDAITRTRSGYRLDLGDAELDVQRFDTLVDRAEQAVPDAAIPLYDGALALWRGRPFGEFSDEWWAVPDATRLSERRTSAEEGRAAALMALGHHNRAIAELERLVVEHPLRERPVALLMQCLRATGRRPDAIRAYGTFRTRLGEETGLEPSQELAELEQALVVDGDVAGRALDLPLRGYTIHEAIGEGAYGRVYAATQPGTDRAVAIKAIRPDVADSADFVRRFEAEAKLVARLEHPHIVPLYDFWREPGGAYLVFRLLTGGSARDSVVVGGPWSLARVGRLVEEIAGALMAAHAAGVAHNDVKATNVLLDDDGAAYLTDFGIAAAGDSAAVDDDAQRADVCDLAWLVWELITGSRPPPGHQGLAESPSLVGRVEALPDGLNAVLARGRSAGFASVAELLLAWREATGYTDGQRTPITSSERHAVDAARGRAARQLALAARAGVNPYRGLRPFEEGDAANFHGRDDAVEALAQLVAGSALVTVTGPSGAGKSSAIRAGLAPRLRRAGTVVVMLTPGDDPLGALREAINEVAINEVAPNGDADPVTSLADQLVDVSRTLGRVVVVVDQFEECWTRAAPHQSERFLDVLADALDDTSADVRVVATVRADLLDRPLDHPRLGHLVAGSLFVLPPLSPTDLEAAIEQPAAHAGVTFGDGVVAELVAESTTQPGSLPLLQFTLAELYDRRTDAAITADALDTVGGIAGAVGRRAEGVYESLDEDLRAATRELFARLVAPGADGAPDGRRRALHGELSTGMRAVADRFVEARLLVTDRDPVTREPTYEVAHEALFAVWPRLADWIDESRRWLLQLQHLSAAARAWDDGGRADTELYRGARLEAALEALHSEGRSVSPLERSFVDHGQHLRDRELLDERRRVKRLRFAVVATSVLAALAIALGAIAVVQRNEARDARTAADSATRDAEIEALVARAESLRATQRDTAALLSIEAFRLADTPRSRSALFATFTDDEHFFDAHRFPGDRGTSGIVLPDGETAFLTGDDGQLRPYDLDSGSLGPPLDAVSTTVDRFPVLASSPDGDRLIQAARSDPASGPTRVGVFDTRSGELVFAPIAVDGAVTSTVFLPDGRFAMAVGESGRLILADGETGSEVASLPGVAVPPDDIIWTLDPTAGGVGRVLRRPSSVAVAGDELLAGTADGTLRVIDPQRFEVTRALELAPSSLAVLAAVGDGTVITAGRAGVARVDLASGEPIWTVAELDHCVNLAVVAERGVLFCGDPYGRLDERDLATGAVLDRFDAQNGNSGSLWTASGGTELVSFGNNEPVVSRWRLDGSGPVTRAIAPGWRLTEFDHASELLLVGRGDVWAGTYTAGLIDTDGGTAVRPVDGLLVPGWRDADTLIGGAIGPAGDVELAHVDVAHGVPTGPPVTSGVPVEDAESIVANDLDTGKDRMLIRYRDGQQNWLAALDTTTLHTGPKIPIDGLVSWAISRSGDRIAAGTSSGVIVYDADTGEQIGALPDSDLRGVTITVTDQMLVSSLGGELTEYDLDTLQPIRTFGSSRGYVFGGAGTADGSLIAIHSGDRSVALFDVASGTQVGGPIAIAPDQVNFARLSLDGRWLAVGGEPGTGEGTTQLWSLEPDRWVDAACRLAGRNLTRQEWATHIGDLAQYRATCPAFPADA